MELLLLSTSTVFGTPYLSYALPQIESWLDGAPELVFVPYALADQQAYSAMVSEALRPLGV